MNREHEKLGRWLTGIGTNLVLNLVQGASQNFQVDSRIYIARGLADSLQDLSRHEWGLGAISAVLERYLDLGYFNQGEYLRSFESVSIIYCHRERFAPHRPNRIHLFSIYGAKNVLAHFG